MQKDEIYQINPKRQGLQILFGDDWKKWSYLQSQLSYVTPCHISVKISELANHYYGKNSKNVWDMFGGLGMDAINLSNFFKTVIVTEIDQKVFQCLQNNIQNVLFSPVNKLKDKDKNDDKNNDKDNKDKDKDKDKDKRKHSVSIEAYNQDAIQKLNDKKFMKAINLVYFDPPWGASFKTGEPFNFNNSIITDSSGNEQNVITLLNKLHDKVKNIIIKSPILSTSFEEWALQKNIQIVQICEFPIHKLKYIFISKE